LVFGERNLKFGNPSPLGVLYRKFMLAELLVALMVIVFVYLARRIKMGSLTRSFGEYVRYLARFHSRRRGAPLDWRTSCDWFLPFL
jgi:hypothetical protein